MRKNNSNTNNQTTSRKRSSNDVSKTARKSGAITAPNGEEYEFGLELGPRVDERQSTSQKSKKSTGRKSSSNSKSK